MLSIAPDAPRTGPSREGLDLSGAEWHLDVERYRPFVEATTGIRPTESLSAAECYRIGNRLEALIEERRRHGEWTPALVEEYPVVESLEEILAVARFFRQCHACHREAGCG
jgi:hypothetical protein